MHATDAINAINAMLANDEEGDISNDFRDFLIMGNEAESPVSDEWIEWVDSLNTEDLTELRLSLSLCPLHASDYAICFDDENPECAQIRIIHPSYDS